MSLKRVLRKTLRDAYYRSFELPLRALPDRPALTGGWDFRVPNDVYQTWDSNFFGKSHHGELEKFRALNPQLNFFIFDDAKCDAFMDGYYKNHEISGIYRKARIAPLKKDIFRYCLLYQSGGFYCDINKALTRPITGFIEKSDTAMISFETNLLQLPPEPAVWHGLLHPDRYAIQSIFGFEKNHILLQRVIENICAYYPLFADRKFRRPKDGVLAFTGPGMFTKSLRETVLDCKNLKQIGMDFEGSFVFNLPGANVMYMHKIKYGDLGACEII